MKPFGYARPDSLAETFALLAEHGEGALLLAGGTDVLVQVRRGRRQPSVVVDLKRVTELGAGVVETDAGLCIGALAVLGELVEHETVRSRFPALAEAGGVVGSVQIRNRAKLAGNICNASPAADTVPALLVYGARLTLASAAGTRTVPLDGFFSGPGRTALAPGELLASVLLPWPEGRCGAAFGRVTRRHGVDLATVNLCCGVRDTGEALFAFGAVGPTPLLFRDASGVLADPHGDSDAREAALAALVARAQPISDVRGGEDYRRAMLMVLARRALTQALARMGSQDGEL